MNLGAPRSVCRLRFQLSGYPAWSYGCFTLSSYVYCSIVLHLFLYSWLILLCFLCGQSRKQATFDNWNWIPIWHFMIARRPFSVKHTLSPWCTLSAWSTLSAMCTFNTMCIFSVKCTFSANLSLSAKSTICANVPSGSNFPLSRNYKFCSKAI